MNREEFIKLHNEIAKKHTSDHWHWQWFIDRVLDRSVTNRFGWFVNTVTKYLKNNMKVLDIAGGIGMFGAYLMKVENFEFDYTVLDLTVMKEVAEDYFKTFGINGKFMVGDITFPNILQYLQIQPNMFDMVWLFSWCQIQGIDCGTFFSEIYKMLKPNGIFMFNMAYGGYAVMYNEEALKLILIKVGFKIEIIERDNSGFAQEYLVLVRK